MCGISGTVGLAEERVIQAMTEAMAHRGPDDQGTYLNPAGKIALGHRRLSIIDLSAAGHQPMSYDNGRYWITFNGEVYNYQEIRADLEKYGHRFHSATDVEVVLAAYAQWGTSCLERLRGMFAFAIWDSQQQELFLARDRFGIKPLLYAQVGSVFLFASEIKTLLASGLVSRQVDKQAIWDYLSFGAIPQPRTILAQVKALLPGHYMVVRQGSVTIRRYWDIAEQTKSQRAQLAHLAYEDAVAELRHRLQQATRYHLIADVPVGAFLSGGVDSSAVVGLMSQRVSQPIKTFSVGFEGEHEHLSELKWAKIAAERFGTEHTEVIVTARDVAGHFDRLISAFDQPSIDGTNTYFVSQATRQEVTVSLSGLGGDELLAGYYHFPRIVRAANLVPSGLPMLQSVTRLLGKWLPGRWRLQLNTLVSSPVERWASLRRLMDEDARVKVVNSKWLDEWIPGPASELYEQFRNQLDPLTQLSYTELAGYLRNTLLRDTDNMSMAHALEVRPVLLDHVLAEFIFALPPEFKLQGQRGKRVFADAVKEILPEQIINRPKTGFEMPLMDWMTGVLGERALAAFASSHANTIFTPAFLSTTRKEIVSGERLFGRPIHRRLWAYFILLEYLAVNQCVLD